VWGRIPFTSGSERAFAPLPCPSPLGPPLQINLLKNIFAFLSSYLRFLSGY